MRATSIMIAAMVGLSVTIPAAAEPTLGDYMRKQIQVFFLLGTGKQSVSGMLTNYTVNYNNASYSPGYIVLEKVDGTNATYIIPMTAILYIRPN